ncbi:MAG: PIN domain-containing protein [Acidobacteriota bacterium]|nr:PIN domain-containing protein [Acidobacteriota bacterium]
MDRPDHGGGQSRSRAKFGLSPEKAARRESEIRRYFPEAWIEGYEDLIPSIATHEKDRHVLAAAVRSGAESIVTYNLKDFPAAVLAPYAILAQGPSTFLKNLYASNSRVVMQAIERQATAIRQPLPYLLDRLRVNVPGFIEAIERRVSD